MSLDINAKAQELLIKLANSIQDREGHNYTPISFTLTEIQLVQSWLEDFLAEAETTLE